VLQAVRVDPQMSDGQRVANYKKSRLGAPYGGPSWWYFHTLVELLDREQGGTARIAGFPLAAGSAAAERPGSSAIAQRI
jgi:hypothetical protein